MIGAIGIVVIGLAVAAVGLVMFLHRPEARERQRRERHDYTPPKHV